MGTTHTALIFVSSLRGLFLSQTNKQDWKQNHKKTGEVST
jgi:hypothetical protein